MEKMIKSLEQANKQPTNVIIKDITMQIIKQ